MIYFVLFLIVFLKTLNVQGMHDAAVVHLEGKGIYSSSGKLLLVFEKDKIAVHETKTGKKLGNLENISSSKCDHADSFIFSPQETYIGYKNQMWKAADQKEHLPGVLKDETVKAWNKCETIFVTAVTTIGGMWNICDAFTADRVRSISHQNEPAHFSISDDGNLASFTYPLPAACYENFAPRSQTVIRDIRSSSNKQPLLTINYGHETHFLSDNTHALVSSSGSNVFLVNAKIGCVLREFICGNNCFSVNTYKNLIPCQISIDSMKCTITHPSARDYFCIINYDGQAFHFEKHTKPAVDPKLLSNTKQFRVRRAAKGPQLYLYKHADVYYRPQLLLDYVDAQEKDAIFAGDHDEHILVVSHPPKHLHVLRPANPCYHRKIPISAITISSDKFSFMFTTLEGKHILCILPHAADILAKEGDSYFSLLPAALRMYLKDFKVLDTPMKANHE